MSEDDQDVDIESDYDEDDEDIEAESAGFRHAPDQRKAHHNALERKRRDLIKESFSSLRNAIPSLQSGRSGKGASVSRSQILKSATVYIQQMTEKNQQVQSEISKLKKMNRQLEHQVMSIERSRGVSSATLAPSPTSSIDSSEGSDGTGSPRVQHKRFKTATK
jgi:Max protein